MRISHTEMLEIIGYALGKEESERLRKHYELYGDFGRIKCLAITELISLNKEIQTLRARCKKQQEEVDRLKQTDIRDFLPGSSHPAKPKTDALTTDSKK